MTRVGKWCMVEVFDEFSGVLLDTYAALRYAGFAHGVDGGDWPCFHFAVADRADSVAYHRVTVEVDGVEWPGVYSPTIYSRTRWGPSPMGDEGTDWELALVCYPVREPYPVLDEVLA